MDTKFFIGFINRHGKKARLLPFGYFDTYDEAREKKESVQHRYKHHLEVFCI